MTRKKLDNQINNNLQMSHGIAIFVILKILSEKKLQEDAVLKKSWEHIPPQLRQLVIANATLDSVNPTPKLCNPGKYNLFHKQ